jgi:hypothetical protein
MTGKFKIAAAAAFAAIIGVASSASHAATTIVTVNSGGTYDGWTITFPQGEGVALLQDVTPSGTNLVLEKFADFTAGSPASFLINFMQSSPTAAGTITITNESVVNGTSANWSGFEMSLGTPLSGLVTAPTITGVFVPPTGGGVDYTNVSTTSSSVTYSGSQPGGTTSLWGEGNNGGQLVIDANPSSGQIGQDFTLKETPLTVPVPAAAWSGLTGLMGLGLLASGKKLKKILA